MEGGRLLPESASGWIDPEEFDVAGALTWIRDGEQAEAKTGTTEEGAKEARVAS
jgi:hypothetical protein